MKIDQLPVEMLMKIFSYLPSYKAVLLVSKHFYDVACKLNDPHTSLSLDLAFFEKENDRQLLHIIHNTKRKISAMNITFCNLNETQARSAISVIEKFSATVKCLYLVADPWDVSDVLEILSLVPNAEHLDFRGLLTRTDYQSSPQKCRTIPSNEELNLLHLKTLTIHYCNEKVMALFNRLPAGVLTKLDIAYQIWRDVNVNALSVLFKQQTNIKKLQLSSIDFDLADTFDNLELESLHLYNHLYDNSSKLLLKQTKLKVLNVGGTASAGLMKKVANHLTELETFSIQLSESTVNGYVHINKLKNLKLSIFGIDVMKFLERFAELNNSRITNLNLRCFTSYFPDDHMRMVAKSVPNLKVLQIGFLFDLEIFHTIRRHFNFVEVLHIECYEHGNDSYVNHLVDGDDYSNEKLVELKMYHVAYKMPLLQKLTVDYPNLKKLIITPSKPFSSTEFRLILNEFPKLESLKLRLTSTPCIDDLHYLMEHKNNLKCVTLKNFAADLTPELKEKLSTSFDVVKLRDGTLSMADYRNILKRELWM